MQLKMPRRTGAAFALSVVMTACVDAPFERINVADSGSPARVVLAGLPDTLHSRGAIASIVPLIADGQLPRRVAGLTLLAEISRHGSGWQQLLVKVGATEFQVGTEVSLIPQEATIYALVAPTNPRRLVEQRVIVWQRPRSAQLACLVLNCSSMTAAGVTVTLTLTLRDSLAYLVNPGSAAMRFGNIVSRAPDVVEVVDRPNPTAVRVRSVGSGAAWIVFEGDGVRDSLQFTVAP